MAAPAVTGVTDSLQPGWNALGLRGLPVTALSSTAVAGFAVWDGTAYQTSSLTVDAVNSGQGARRGLWVFATGAGTVSHSATDPGLVSLDLRAGWNLLAFPSTAPVGGSSLVTRSNGSVVPLNTVLLPQFSQLGPGGASTTIDVSGGGQLTPGRAYWVFAASAVNLRYGSDPAGSPSPHATPTPTGSPEGSPTPTPGSSPTASPGPTVFPSPSPGPTLSPSPSPGPTPALTSTNINLTGMQSAVGLSDDGRYLGGSRFDNFNNIYIGMHADLLTDTVLENQPGLPTFPGNDGGGGVGPMTADGSREICVFKQQGQQRSYFLLYTRSSNSNAMEFEDPGNPSYASAGPFFSAAGDRYSWTYQPVLGGGLDVKYKGVGAPVNTLRAAFPGIFEPGGLEHSVQNEGRKSLSDDGRYVLVRDQQVSGGGAARIIRFDIISSAVVDLFWVGEMLNMKMSGDAQFVLYHQNNTNQDVFLRKVGGGVPDEMVSVSSTGAIANNLCENEAVSSDARFVLFWSAASNLVPNDTNGVADLFLRDRQNSTTARVSVDSTGAQFATAITTQTAIMSRNGQWIVFRSPVSPGNWFRVRNPAL